LWPSSKTRVATVRRSPDTPDKQKSRRTGRDRCISKRSLDKVFTPHPGKPRYHRAHTALESNFDKGKIQDQLDIQTQAVALGTQAMDV
jgi:hypothetical protein